MKYLRGSKITQIEIANEFYETSLACFALKKDRIYAIPGFVNGLFACELYFKIIVGDKIKELEGKDRHDLHCLYNLLKEEEKEKLKSAYHSNDYTLEHLLSIIGDGYTKWRYIYENGNEKFGDGYPFQYTEEFINHYAPTLKAMATYIVSNNT